MRSHRHRAIALTGALALAALLAGCSGGDGNGGGATPTSDTLGPRPSSPAKLTVVSPHNGATIANGAELEVRLA